MSVVDVFVSFVVSVVDVFVSLVVPVVDVFVSLVVPVVDVFVSFVVVQLFVKEEILIHRNKEFVFQQNDVE